MTIICRCFFTLAFLTFIIWKIIVFNRWLNIDTAYFRYIFCNGFLFSGASYCSKCPFFLFTMLVQKSPHLQSLLCFSRFLAPTINGFPFLMSPLCFSFSFFRICMSFVWIYGFWAKLKERLTAAISVARSSRSWATRATWLLPIVRSHYSFEQWLFVNCTLSFSFHLFLSLLISSACIAAKKTWPDASFFSHFCEPHKLLFCSTVLCTNDAVKAHLCVKFHWLMLSAEYCRRTSLVLFSSRLIDNALFDCLSFNYFTLTNWQLQVTSYLCPSARPDSINYAQTRLMNSCCYFTNEACPSRYCFFL